MNYRLGRLPRKEDSRNLKAERYMTQVSPPPLAVDWGEKVPEIPLYANNRVGDCTCASHGHEIGSWTFNASGAELIFKDDQILAAYSAVSGYNPDDPQTDVGATLLDVLKYARSVGIGGHPVYAYVELTPSNHDQIKQAINLFGGIYVGVNLPITAQSQIGGVWTVGSGFEGQPGSWGGHAIYVPTYDETGLTCFTWGARQRMNWGFWDYYCDEGYAVISNDFIYNGKDPQGFDLATLNADLVAVGQNRPTPPPQPTPTPTPAPSGCLPRAIRAMGKFQNQLGTTSDMVRLRRAGQAFIDDLNKAK
jgi:hypothetical protein